MLTLCDTSSPYSHQRVTDCPKSRLMASTFHVAANPLSDTVRSSGRKLPWKLGVAQLDVSSTEVLLPMGRNISDSEPFSGRCTE